MTANPWILAFHLIALFFWLGQLIVLTRLLAFHVDQAPELQQKLSRWETRTWLAAGVGDGLVVLITGLLMLHGVGYAGFDSPGAALGNYLKPKLPGGEPSLWYVTFHVKLVSFTLLALIDVWLGAQVFRLARKQPPRRAWPLATLLGLSVALLSNVVVWLSFAGLVGGPTSRLMGYGAGLLGGIGGAVAGAKLGRGDTSRKFSIVHGVVAALVILIVILVIAKPLAFAGNTLQTG